MFISTSELGAMEKRLAATAAGLKELEVLRERHQQEIQQMLTSIRMLKTDDTDTVS